MNILMLFSLYFLSLLDVIDWMLDNLIDKTRTRRGVIKKLKDMGLIFKAPTKKSIATANKNLWQPDEDERLSALYNEFRFENGENYRLLVSLVYTIIGFMILLCFIFYC